MKDLENVAAAEKLIDQEMRYHSNTISSVLEASADVITFLKQNGVCDFNESLARIIIRAHSLLPKEEAEVLLTALTKTSNKESEVTDKKKEEPKKSTPDSEPSLILTLPRRMPFSKEQANRILLEKANEILAERIDAILNSSSERKKPIVETESKFAAEMKCQGLID